METSLYFLNVCGLCRGEKNDIYRQVCDQSCFAVAGGLAGNRRSGFRRMNGCICFSRDLWEEGGDPAGTPEDLQCVLEKHSSAWWSEHVCEKCCRRWTQFGSEQKSKRRGMCHLQRCHWYRYLKKHTFVSNDTTYADFNTKENVLPRRYEQSWWKWHILVQVGPKKTHSKSS